ncbi:recombinase RecT [Nocardia sp. NPDC052278]|uniref:recombinase RecT n=1 Tax=unclassified Nocardia TaxID=2637762 RepID=UPI0036769FB8
MRPEPDKAPTTLTIKPDQLSFSTEQRQALEQLGYRDLPESQLVLFFHVAKRSGLDPFSKQIYLKADRYQLKDRDEYWTNDIRWSIVTSIEGYRAIGHRAARHCRDTINMPEPLWYDGNENRWVEVWVPRDFQPAAAKYAITIHHADGRTARCVGIAHFEEFVQHNSEGGPNTVWAQRPAHQIAKCAEAQAWRHAYPADFAGIELQDTLPTGLDLTAESDQNGNVAASFKSAARLRSSAPDELTATAQSPMTARRGPGRAITIIDEAASTSSDYKAADTARGAITKTMSINLDTLLRDAGYIDADSDEALAFISKVIGCDIGKTSELTRDQGAQLIEALQQSDQRSPDASATSPARSDSRQHEPSLAA